LFVKVSYSSVFQSSNKLSRLQNSFLSRNYKLISLLCHIPLPPRLKVVCEREHALLAALLMASRQTLDTTTKPHITSILSNMADKGKTIGNIQADEETSH